MIFGIYIYITIYWQKQQKKEALNTVDTANCVSVHSESVWKFGHKWTTKKNAVQVSFLVSFNKSWEQKSFCLDELLMPPGFTQTYD